MLRYFYDNNLVAISKKTPKDWEEAIRLSGEILKQNELITDQYVDQVINDVKEYGPYIVIVPGVAMPHSSAKRTNPFYQTVRCLPGIEENRTFHNRPLIPGGRIWMG